MVSKLKRPTAEVVTKIPKASADLQINEIESTCRTEKLSSLEIQELKSALHDDEQAAVA